MAVKPPILSRYSTNRLALILPIPYNSSANSCSVAVLRSIAQVENEKINQKIIKLIFFYHGLFNCR